MLVEKNKEYIVEIIDNGYEGEGIAKIDGFTVFVPNSIKGEIAKIMVVKVLSSHAFGKVIEIIKPSPDRVNPDCSTYKRCGGCSLRHIAYPKTLEMKQQVVQNLVNKGLQAKIHVEKVIGMEHPYHYRNKIQFPVGIDKNGKPQMGVFASRTHEIIPVETCMLQNELAQEIAKSAFSFWVNHHFSFYDEKTQKGELRHIIVKVGVKTNQYMCIMVINGKKMQKQEEFVTYLTTKFPEIKTIVLNSNMKNTNVILGEKNEVLYGDGYITDQLGDFEFQISPFSFYQVNPVQAEKLYHVAVQATNITKKDLVFDLYCGVGTISLFMATYAKKVYGVEIVEEAVDMARENARMNQIDNVEFIAGDVEKVVQELIEERKILPDVIMIDPPRRGLDVHTIENIRKVSPTKVVYISCNPATLVRDLHMLEDMYEITKIVPVDLFPFTNHVECVAVLQLKQDM